jgi:hypothetical protein
MATKYTILETTHTEESEPFSSKAKAVEAADAAAEEYPGTPFRVATGKGTVVHTAFAESVDVVDEPPVDEVPEAPVDADASDDFDAALAEVVGGGDLEPELDDDVDEDFEPESDENVLPDAAFEPDNDEDNTPGDNAKDAGQDGAEEDSELDEGDQKAMRKLAGRALRTSKADAPGGTTFLSGAKVVKEMAEASATAAAPTAAAPAATAPAGATLELCAANTNAKRMHYRTIGETRTACGSANTSRRANAHQIETASLCPACEKLASGQPVDTRPAGAARGGSGSRRAPKTVVVDAGEIRDLVAHLKKGDAFEMETTDGQRIRFVAGDPVTGDVDETGGGVSDMQSLKLVAA